MNIKSKILNCKKKVSGLVGKVIIGAGILGLLAGSVKAANYSVEGFALKQNYSPATGDTATAHIATRPGEVLQDVVNSDGLYNFSLANFATPWSVGEKLIVNVKNGSRKARTQIDSIPGPTGGGFRLPDLVINEAANKKRMVNVFDVVDTSKITGNLYAIVTPWKTMQPCTTLIDTGIDQGWTFWDDAHVITPLVHGDTFDFEIVKEGTSNKTSRDSLVYDPTKFIDAFVITPERYGTIYFPEKIVGPIDTTAPTINLFTSKPDTNFAGPYGIGAKIYDESGVDSAKTWLKFQKNGIEDSVNAYQINPSDSTWKFSIPKVDTTADTTRIDYQVVAKDKSPAQNKSESGIQSFLVDAKKPSISYSDSLEDRFNRGPFNVRTVAWDATGIDSSKCSLDYKVSGSPESAPVDSFKADTAYFTIPEVPGSDTATVSYSSKITDNFGNYSETPEHSFKLKTNGVPEGPMASKKELKIYPNPFYSDVNISYPTKNAELNIYNTAGQLVDKVKVNDYRAKWGKDASNGIYFVRPAKPDELNGKIEVNKKVWKLIKL